MEQNINISEILKDKPVGLKFYSNTFGYISFNGVHKDKVYFFSEDTNAHSVKPNGKMYDGGECIIFPSKEMRDWEKFSWKKGDVLVSKDREVHIIFEKFEDDAFTKFRGKHYLWKECYNEEVFQMETSVFEKASDDDAQTYINTIEKFLVGKLNRETLEIEKPAKLKFEIGKFYVFNEDDEDGELTIIGELIAKNESEDTLTFGNQYEIENEKFVTDQTFDLRISVNKELREATENEVELFNKHYAIWKKEKEAKEHRAFKPFDKVLVRSGDNYKWLPALFIRDRGVGFESRHTALPIHSGEPASFAQCISYDGNEYLAFTSDPF